MSANQLDNTKYTNMVNNASSNVKISSSIFKEFIGDVKDVVNQHAEEINAHKVETVSYHTVITEPVAQSTTTTVVCGFRPTFVQIGAVILGQNAYSEGKSDRTNSSCIVMQKSLNVFTAVSGTMIFLGDSTTPTNAAAGVISLNDTGFTITWTITGTPAGTSRRFSILAGTHY